MEWDKCQFLIMTRHSLEKLPPIQIVEKDVLYMNTT